MASGDEDEPAHDVRGYYEAEATQRLRKDLTGRRVDIRDAFIASIAGEGRTSVIDFGAGPGHDGAAFRAAGLAFMGIDLAVGNAHLAAESDVHVVPGSVMAPPVRLGSFEAGWSMSTLMHLPESESAAAAAAMAQVLRPGSPMWIGLWGSDAGSAALGVRIDETIEGERRPFYRRTLAHNHDLLSAAGTVESSELWDTGRETEYHVFQIRT